MIIKTKELNEKCILLDITNGVYEIKVQQTISKREFGMLLYTYSEEEVLESYDASDYSLKEVIDKLEEIYNLLKWDYQG